MQAGRTIPAGLSPEDAALWMTGYARTQGVAFGEVLARGVIDGMTLCLDDLISARGRANAMVSQAIEKVQGDLSKTVTPEDLAVWTLFAFKTLIDQLRLAGLAALAEGMRN